MRELKRIVKSALRTAGLEVRQTRELPFRAPDIRHAEMSPAATYSPWLSDEEFRTTYQAVGSNTLVDRYRCYELWQLTAEVAKLTAGDIIEIGVWRGGSGALVARKCQLVGIPNAVYLCDTFSGVVKAGSLDGTYRGGEHADTTKAAVLDLCKQLHLDQVQILNGIFPDDTGHLVSDCRFRLCHIDVDVYRSASDIVEWIWPRMVPGGIIVYDDYGFHSCSGITRFVNEERMKQDRLVIHNLNGHAVVIKMSESTQGVSDA
jgi:O-methyltransferase